MITAIGIMIIIFLFMLFFAYHVDKEKRSAERLSSAENLCIRIASAASGIYLAGPGSEMNLTVDRNATFEAGSSIFIDLGEEEVFCRTPVNFTNSTDATFTLHDGSASVRNERGALIIQQSQ